MRNFGRFAVDTQSGRENNQWKYSSIIIASENISTNEIVQ